MFFELRVVFYSLPSSLAGWTHFPNRHGTIAAAILVQQFHGLFRHAPKPGGVRQFSLEKFAGDFRMTDGCLHNHFSRRGKAQVFRQRSTAMPLPGRFRKATPW